MNRNADFFYKTNRFESIRITNRIESIRIANWNARARSCRVGRSTRSGRNVALRYVTSRGRARCPARLYRLLLLLLLETGGMWNADPGPPVDSRAN